MERVIEAGTSAKVITDSINSTNNRLTTFEVEYPRIVHSELMTHRVFSRNSSSSRAIPAKRMRQLVKDKTFIPTNFGSDKAGMQAGSNLTGYKHYLAKSIWWLGSRINLFGSYLLSSIGVHKQLANRCVEPYSYIKVIISATEYQNFFDLRCHPDAQPEIQELACIMRDKYLLSVPKILKYGEWHTPYVNDSAYTVTTEQSKKLSVSLCAQVSYRVLNTSIDKSIKITDRLAGSVPIHASPFEHVATPCNNSKGNFKGWKQYRQDIEQ